MCFWHFANPLTFWFVRNTVKANANRCPGCTDVYHLYTWWWFGPVLNVAFRSCPTYCHGPLLWAWSCLSCTETAVRGGCSTDIPGLFPFYSLFYWSVIFEVTQANKLLQQVSPEKHNSCSYSSFAAKLLSNRNYQGLYIPSPSILWN